MSGLDDLFKPRYYVSGKFDDDTGVGRIITALADNGFRLTLDWRKLDVRNPYRDNPEFNRVPAHRMRTAISQAEVFVLVGAPNLHGALIELGMALSDPRPAVVHLVGQTHQSIFDTLSGVQHWHTVDAYIESIAERARYL